MRLRRLQTFANQIHVLLWCLNAFGGLLLETVQNVDPLGDLDRIDGTVRVAHVVFNHLQNTGTTKSLQWLCLVMLLARLRQIQRKPKDVDDVVGHGQQILLRGSNPVQWLQVIGHSKLYPNGSK